MKYNHITTTPELFLPAATFDEPEGLKGTDMNFWVLS